MIPATWLTIAADTRDDGRCEVDVRTPLGVLVFRAVGQARDGADLPFVFAACVAWVRRQTAVAPVDCRTVAS